VIKIITPSLLLGLCSCGQVVPDKVVVEHTINIDVITPYIEAYCKETAPDTFKQCFDFTIGKLLEKL